MTVTQMTRTSIGAVVVAAVVATPFLLRVGDDAPPPPAPPVGNVPAGALSGDVDGDGTEDVVTLQRSDELRVRLGAGVTVAHLLQDGPRLEGLADVGSGGLAVVTSQATGDGSRDWTAWLVRNGDLVALRTHHRAVLGSEPGSSTAWVSVGRLYDGSLDALQHDADRVAVAARSWQLQDGRLASTAAGVLCWDRDSEGLPASCAPGQDWRYDVGPHRDLPALLPTVHPAWADRTRTSFGADRWVLRNLDPDADPDVATYALVHESHRSIHTVRVPRGWTPSLFRSPVRLGGTDGVLLSQEGGDSDTWRVYGDIGGRLQQLGTRGPLPLGGGFTADGGSAYYSWLTPGGHLYTRVGAEQPGHFHVWAWQPTGAGAATAPTLVARALGTVCFDETWQTYGTCAALSRNAHQHPAVEAGHPQLLAGTQWIAVELARGG
jgi:hypothetical protein